jgi:hypothetical protein
MRDRAGPPREPHVLADTEVAEFFWHQVRGLRADEIDMNAHTLLWIICDQFHVSKRKAAMQRNAVHLCPVCTNAILVRGVNDFATTHPAQAASFVKPGASGIGPDSASQITRATATWRCDQGHEFRASFSQMATKRSDHCSCANHLGLSRGHNDIASRNPVLAAQWDSERNGCRADTVNVGSSKRYWWICPAGHRFEATPRQRMRCAANSNGCRLCLWSSPIDPVTHQHVVDAALRPTPAQLTTYFDPPRPPRRPSPRQKPRQNTPRKRRSYPNTLKKRAVQRFHEIRPQHRSHLQAQIAVAKELGIDGPPCNTLGKWVKDARWAVDVRPVDRT